MPYATYATLEALRTELRTRLGYGSAGGVPGVVQTLLNSFLKSAQDELYWSGSWPELRVREDLTLSAGGTLLDYPTDCNANRIEDIYVRVSNTWMQVREGIDKELYTTVDSPNYPSRYERLSQLEFWPESDQAYTVRVWYYKNLLRFTQDADRATINDTFIFHRALAIGKAHYRHPDAELANTIAQNIGGGVKSGAWRQKVFSKDSREDTPLAKPRTI